MRSTDPAIRAARVRGLSNALASILDVNATGMWTNRLDDAAIKIRAVLEEELSNL